MGIHQHTVPPHLESRSCVCSERRKEDGVATRFDPGASPLTPSTMAARTEVLHLYRRSLKLALDWAVHRYLWRGQAVYIRSLFEANKHITQPRQQRALIDQTEEILNRWKHPDPYKPPTAPGGSKHERNLPVPSTEPPPEMHL